MQARCEAAWICYSGSMKNGDRVIHKPTSAKAVIADRFFDGRQLYVSINWDVAPPAPFGRMDAGGKVGHVAVSTLIPEDEA